jgi:hypothetical protein
MELLLGMMVQNEWVLHPEGDGQIFTTDNRGYAEYVKDEYFGGVGHIRPITPNQIAAADAAYNGEQ